MSFESIRTLIKEDLEATNRFMVPLLSSQLPLINEIVTYILGCGGKRIRPILLLLCAAAFNYRGNAHIELAAVIELIHTATLLHDDVVDGAALRRGKKTAHIIWGNDTSVLVGDFLYSRAFQIVVNQKQEKILDIFSRATHHIIEGELLQLMNCNNAETSENFYFDIIERKTAKLFEVSAMLGAILGTQNELHIEAIGEYGLNLGIAYQLIDDALDYSSQSKEQTGKTLGQDLSEGKVTLPLIYTMAHCQPEALKMIQKAIKNNSSKNLTAILDIIESTDAIKYTAQTAKNHAEKAKKALSVLAFSPYRQALEDLSDFVVARTY